MIIPTSQVVLNSSTTFTSGDSADDTEKRQQLREGLFVGLTSWSQLEISSRLAQLHPDLTIPIFSGLYYLHERHFHRSGLFLKWLFDENLKSTEITHRLASASQSNCQLMLDYLLPWIFNIELVDFYNTNNSTHTTNNTIDSVNSLKEFFPHLNASSLPGSGWGSIEASIMVVNNLMYLSIKVVWQERGFEVFGKFLE